MTVDELRELAKVMPSLRTDESFEDLVITLESVGKISYEESKRLLLLFEKYAEENYTSGENSVVRSPGDYGL